MGASMGRWVTPVGANDGPWVRRRGIVVGVKQLPPSTMGQARFEQLLHPYDGIDMRCPDDGIDMRCPDDGIDMRCPDDGIDVGRPLRHGNPMIDRLCRPAATD